MILGLQALVEAFTAALDLNTGALPLPLARFQAPAPAIFFSFSPCSLSFFLFRSLAQTHARAHTHTHAHAGTYLVWAHSNRWLGVRLDLIGALITLCAALVAVRQRTFGEVRVGGREGGRERKKEGKKERV